MYYPVIEICSVPTCSFCRGADLGSSLRSAATCSVWKTKDAEDLIKLCGGLTQNIEIISKVRLGLLLKLMIVNSLILSSTRFVKGYSFDCLHANCCQIYMDSTHITYMYKKQVCFFIRQLKSN